MVTILKLWNDAIDVLQLLQHNYYYYMNECQCACDIKIIDDIQCPFRTDSQDIGET